MNLHLNISPRASLRKRLLRSMLLFYFSRLNFLHVLLEPVAVIPSGNPCVPSPCGPNSQCRVIGNTPACSCLPNYIGRAPNCRPECVISAECPSDLACQNERCVDPCPGSCGANADCTVIVHKSVCSCAIGYTGDPFAGCILIPSKIQSVLDNCCNTKRLMQLYFGEAPCGVCVV